MKESREGPDCMQAAQPSPYMSTSCLEVFYAGYKIQIEDDECAKDREIDTKTSEWPQITA